jgi:hypothetical protein
MIFMEIFALGGSCDGKFVTKYRTLAALPGTPEVFSEYVWPTAVHLADSSNISRGEEPAPFVTDKESIRTAFAEMDRQRAKLPKAAGAERAKYCRDVDVYFTVTGMLRMKPPSFFEAEARNGGGYGHLNMYPAELVIKTISDLLVQLKSITGNREAADKK